MTENYKGRCFEAAHNAGQDLCDKGEIPFIVYGFVRRFDNIDNLWIVHSWVESKGMVYDYTYHKEPILKDIYYSKNNVYDLKWRYDFINYIKQAVKIGRFSPIDPVLESMVHFDIAHPEMQYEEHYNLLKKGLTAKSGLIKNMDEEDKGYWADCSPLLDVQISANSKK